ncbi:large conductance mechanosensitive channel protein MscL [Paenibacillus sp. 79R4]|uniref:large conductance mechanosensitive channel protein MscL n=1 Tax=Paenibacillus sp. 79R4 TaxID=2212847 RepID=UPI001C4DCD2A|nr:large conductance mechanosensitive channel protein MscL [Paenibacillus sp. 79R4]NWL88268.1 large conductance mechanosensitive channel protein MscL [Paenibacillus sp. 79R4]
MSILKEFKEFALKGNVLDLAVGVVIGGAFGKIVASLVSDVIMPLVGMLLGGVNLSRLVLTVGDAELAYGVFLQTVIDFLIISAAIFLFIKAINKFKRKEEAKPAAEEAPKPSNEEVLLTEIRDLLRQQNNKAAE